MTTRTAPPTPGDGDMYGIVSRNESFRLRYGNRLSHGTVRASGLRPVIVVAGIRPAAPARTAVAIYAAAPRAAGKSQSIATPSLAAVVAAKAQTVAEAPVRSITVGDVLKAASEAWGVSREDILSKRIGRREVWPRLASYLLLRNHTPLSLPAIGRALCRKDHTSAMSGIRKAITLREGRAEFRERYERAEASIAKPSERSPQA